MNTIDQLLTKLDACKEAQDWAKGKTFEEVYSTCHRGDWLNWLFAKTNPEDVQLMILVKGHQANTVRHLMTDERSIKAIDTAIAFGEGKVTEEELRKDAHAAYDAADAAYNVIYEDIFTRENTFDRKAANDADHKAWAASAAAAAACDVSGINTATAVVRAGEYSSKQENQQLMADIFRKYISIDKFNLINI